MKKTVLFAVLFIFAFSLNCGGLSSTNRPNQKNESPEFPTPVGKQSAVDVAKAELAREKKSPEAYDMKTSEEANAWRMEFQLKDIMTMGGTVTYVIDKNTGKILNRQESQ